jgi:membrane associated rhomboid family serine protease
VPVLLPLGLDTTRLNRLPRASLAIAGLCVIAFLFTECSGAGSAVQSAAEECERYYSDHPYLAIPDVLVERFGVEDDGPAPVPGDVSAEQVRLEQVQLDELAQELVSAVDANPARRFAFVPERGVVQPGWITHQFLHGGWLHLIGNLLIFLLVVGPFLEDVWGILFFSGFYLVGGVVAAMFQIPFMPAHVALVGASGAISACLGAFLLRFAHRKVRMIWMPFFPLWTIRKQFFVPAWLYAIFGFAMDVLALRASDPAVGGGVANGAHVGGFLFGVCVALGVRWTGLEARISPDGAPEWKQGMALNRAADALAAGDLHGARSRIHEALSKEPKRADARLELARLEARQLNAGAVAEALEPVLAERLANEDAAGVRSLLAEFHGQLQPDRFRPATAYRLAEVVERDDPQLSLALLQVAGGAAGGLGAKALARAAQRLAGTDPERARELLDRAEQLAGDPDLLGRVRAVRATLPPARGGAGAAAAHGGAPEHGTELREVWCRVSAIDGGRLTLVGPDGRAARLDPARVAHVAAALLERLQVGGQERRNGVVLDLVLHPAAPGARVLLRIAGHDLGLQAHRPGIPAAVAFAELVEALQIEGATAWPDAARAQGKPFARFPDLEAYERACYGRSLRV